MTPEREKELRWFPEGHVVHELFAEIDRLRDILLGVGISMNDQKPGWGNDLIKIAQGEE